MMQLTNHCNDEFTVTFEGEDYRDFRHVIASSIHVLLSRFEKGAIRPASLNWEKGRRLLDQLPKPDDTERGIPPEHREVKLSLQSWETCYQILVLTLYGTWEDEQFIYSVYVLTRQEILRLLEEFHLIYLKMLRMDYKGRSNPNVNEVIKRVLAGELQELSTLLSSGNVNVDERDKNRRTALMHAAIDGMCEIAQELINAGADVNAPGFSGERPLHLAAREDNVDMVKLLLKCNAEVDLEDKYGNTALWEAVLNSPGQSELIPVLLAAGADPHHKNKSGETPIQLANTIANREVVQRFLNIRM